VIYDIHWGDEREFVTASSDETAKVWNRSSTDGKPILVLEHGYFVYCARFHPTAKNPRFIFLMSVLTMQIDLYRRI
jgi:WD40 repeat protein